MAIQSLPKAISRNYPSAGKKWGWQSVFPSGVLPQGPENAVVCQQHIYPDTLGRAVKRASRAA